jgi:hypothetical protein
LPVVAALVSTTAEERAAFEALLRGIIERHGERGASGSGPLEER